MLPRQLDSQELERRAMMSDLENQGDKRDGSERIHTPAFRLSYPIEQGIYLSRSKLYPCGFSTHEIEAPIRNLVH